jgi:polar amino acid transport system substrate-binding protein
MQGLLQRRRLLSALTGLGLLASARGARGQSRPDTLVFVYSRPRSNPYSQWLIRLYTEALGRMGIGFEFRDVPPARATALSSAGLVDGELGRTWEFASLYPSLVRVEEPNIEVLFSAYAARAMPPMDGWEALRRSNLTVGYRQGILEIERELAAPAYRDRVTGVASIDSGLKMLRRGRVDLYVDVESAVEEFLATPQARAEAQAEGWPRPIGVMQSTTGHAYLHQRHAALAPALAVVLRAMKAEGLHARYLAEALSVQASDE